MPVAEHPDSLLTVADVAARLAVDPDGVLALIHGGRLRAIDVARPGSRRPRWRIMPDDLQTFLDSRRTAPRPAASRRRKATAGVIEFFR